MVGPLHEKMIRPMRFDLSVQPCNGWIRDTLEVLIYMPSIMSVDRVSQLQYIIDRQVGQMNVVSWRHERILTHV